MMPKKLLIALVALALPALAVAQVQNYIVPTAPPGTSNNQAASTAFVQGAAFGGFPTPVLPVNASAVDTTVNGTIGAGSTLLTLSASWDIRANQGIWLPFAGPAPTSSSPSITGITVNCGPLETVTATGSITAGQTSSVTFTSGSLAGSPLTISYVQKTGDQLFNVASQLATLINANSVLNGARILATTNGATILDLHYPSTLTVSFGASGGGTVTLTPAGPTGCTTTTAYQLIARDANGAYSAASPVTNGTNAAANNVYNRATALLNTNVLTFTVDANAVDVIVYRNNAPIAVVPASDGTFTDMGQFSIGTSARDIPLTPPASSGNGPLITTVAGVVGTLVTLSAPTVAPIVSGPVYHDDGAALQAAITTACPFQKLQVPQGTYNLHQTLQCINVGPGNGMWLAGEGGTQRLGTGVGTIFTYWGRGDKAVFYFDRLSGSKFSDFHILANYYALFGMVYDNTNLGGSSSGNVMEDVAIYRVNSGANSSTMAMGQPGCSGPTVQISEMGFRGVYFYVNDAAGSSRNGFRAFCTGNTKNFMFSDNYAIVGAFNAVEAASGSGNWSFVQGAIADTADTAFVGVTTLHVEALEAENVGGSRLANIPGGGFPCFAEMHAIQWLTPPPSPENFAVEASNCNVSVSDSRFGSGTFSGEFRFNVNALREPNPTHPGGIFSKNNFYEGSAFVPFWSGGNKISDIAQFPNSNGNVVKRLAITSIGDTGQPATGGWGQAGSFTNFETKDMTGGQRFADRMYTTQWLTNSPVASTSFFDIYGGGANFIPYATPSAPTVTRNTTGATTCGYKIAFRDGTGLHTTAVSAATTNVNCAATPNNTISAVVPDGVYFMDVIDNVSGMLVGTVDTSQFQSSTFSLIDTGQAQSAYSPPSAFNNTGLVTFGLSQNVTKYSAAGTALPTCNSTTDAMTAVVSDATGATFRGAYTSGGAQTARVLCVNGTGWITD